MMTTVVITDSHGNVLRDEKGTVDPFDRQEVFLALTKALAGLMDIEVKNTNRPGIPMGKVVPRGKPPRLSVKQRPRGHLSLVPKE